MRYRREVKDERQRGAFMPMRWRPMKPLKDLALADAPARAIGSDVQADRRNLGKMLFCSFIVLLDAVGRVATEVRMQHEC